MGEIFNTFQIAIHEMVTRIQESHPVEQPVIKIAVDRKYYNHLLHDFLGSENTIIDPFQVMSEFKVRGVTILPRDKDDF